MHNALLIPTWSLATLPALAVAEYLAHRLVMHHATPLAARSFDLHAVQHHRLGRHDVNIDTPPWWCLLLASPAILAAYLLAGWPAGTGIALAASGYGVLWTAWHRAIHGLGGDWSAHLPFFDAVRRHHLEHHRRPGRNFGAAFGPLLDLPLGTHSRPNS